MQIRCPHCHNPIELVDGHAAEILCAACGSTFRLGEERTPTYVGDQIRVGKFQLLEKVGTGAFGVVWKAHDTELDRRVAVKIPHAGRLASEQETQRFLREARSAAQLRHPGIVSVHEVGQCEGIPYLVCDFVEGVTLSDLLTARPPGFRDAADLVAQVAEALDYAHSMGVVHRDIKPSNIMLERGGGPRAQGGEPEPSEQSTAGSPPSALGPPPSSGSRPSTLDPRPLLLDFGLALRDEGEITMTLDGQVLGTPAYMSPEQAGGLSHKVDARSDVYSLGVVLYLLLTGELPFRGNSRMLIDQVLREEPRPPRRINDKIPRDLDTVCLKAMSKTPARRYASAREFADDLRRWSAGMPIHARRVGNPERLWRWCKRNPALAALTAAVALLMIVATSSSSLLAVGATRARDRAEIARRDSGRHEREAKRQARISDDILSFLTNVILSQADPEREPNRDITLRQAVNRATAKLDTGLFENPETDTRVRIELGKVYFNLGDYARSRDLFNDALRIARENLGESHPIAMKALDQLGKAHMRLDEFADAERVLVKAYELQTKALGQEHEDTIHSYAKLGDLYRQTGKLHEAEEITKKVLEMRQRLWGDEYEFTLVSMNGLGLLYLDLDRPAESLPLFEQAVQVATRTLGENHTSTLVYMHNHALAYARLERWEEAIRHFSECLANDRKILGDDHPGTLHTEHGLARVLYGIGNYDDARQRLESILDRAGPSIAEDHSFRGIVLVLLGKCFTALDRYEEAERSLQKAQAILLKKVGPNHKYSRAAVEALEELLERKNRNRTN